MAAAIKVALLHSTVSDYGNNGRQISNVRPFEQEGDESLYALYWPLTEPLAFYDSGQGIGIVQLEEQSPGKWSAIAQAETPEGIEALVRFSLEEIERPDRPEDHCYSFQARAYLDLEAVDPELAG